MSLLSRMIWLLFKTNILPSSIIETGSLFSEEYVIVEYSKLTKDPEAKKWPLS